MGWEHRWFATVHDVESIVNALRHKAGIDSDVESEVRRDRYFLTGLDTVGAKVRDARNTEVHATIRPLPDDEIEIKWRIDKDAGTEKLKKCTLLAKQATRDILTSTLPIPSTVTPVLASMQGSKPASILVDKIRWKDDVYVNSDSFVGMLSFEICVCKLVSDPTSWLELGPTAAALSHTQGREVGGSGRASPRPAGTSSVPCPPTWLSVCVEGSKVPGVLAGAGLDLQTVLPPSTRAGVGVGVYTGSYSAWLTHCVQPYMVARDASPAPGTYTGLTIPFGTTGTGTATGTTASSSPSSYAHAQAHVHGGGGGGHTIPWAQVAGQTADYRSTVGREEVSGASSSSGSPGRPPLAHAVGGMRSPARSTGARSAGTQRTPPRSAGTLRSVGALSLSNGRVRGSGSGDWTGVGHAGGGGGGSSAASVASMSSSASSVPSAAVLAYEASLSDPGPHPLASARARGSHGDGAEPSLTAGPLDAHFPLHPKQAQGGSSISADGMTLTLRISPRTSPRSGGLQGGSGGGQPAQAQAQAQQRPSLPPATIPLATGGQDYSQPTAFTAGLLAASKGQS